MSYEAHRRWRAELRATRPSLLDLGELDVYRSLAPSLGAIAASDDRQAQHRCHLSERFLDRLGLDRSLGRRALVTHGVRRSLSALFAMFAAERARVALPGDVYPTYLSLARDAGLAHEMYQARHGLPEASVLDALDVLLVCSPLKPWGGDGAIHRAIEWARGDRRRVLLVDSVYATPPSRVVLDAAEKGELVLLTSLSKGWLIPDHVGLCLVRDEMVAKTRDAFAMLKKDPQKLRIGFAALTEERDRPERVAELLRARAAELDAFTSARPELEAGPCQGYFAVSDRSADALIELGVIAIRGDVFGGSAAQSVLSSLAPVAL